MKLPNWHQIAGSVWLHSSGLRIHLGGLINVNGRQIWARSHPHSVEWDRWSRICGGNRKRGLMAMAIKGVGK
jgi:hypothetical protein